MIKEPRKTRIQVGLRVHYNEYEQLNEIAESENSSLSDFVYKIVKRWIDNYNDVDKLLNGGPNEKCI